MKTILFILISTLSACSLSADYHLAKITDTYQSSKQIYHLERYRAASGQAAEELAQSAKKHQPPASFKQALGGFTVSS